ncbi:MAG: hypothetical protein Q7J98_09300 [Kiritimatiellia bacterium]|nr:hypothetical protein [Kiritimatiellia bacterium]
MSLKSFLVGLVIAAFTVVSLNAIAEDLDAMKAKAAHELTLTGKLILKEDIKGEVKATDKVGKKAEVIKIKGFETIICKYALETADGEVALPEPKAKAGEKAIDMETLIGKNVKIVAKGTEKTVGGKKVIKVKKIISVTEEAAPADAPEAVPAEAPAAPAAE